MVPLKVNSKLTRQHNEIIPSSRRKERPISPPAWRTGTLLYFHLQPLTASLPSTRPTLSGRIPHNLCSMTLLTILTAPRYVSRHPKSHSHCHCHCRRRHHCQCRWRTRIGSSLIADSISDPPPLRLASHRNPRPRARRSQWRRDSASRPPCARGWRRRNSPTRRRRSRGGRSGWCFGRFSASPRR